MSGRRRRRRASEQRLAKGARRTPLTIWAIILIALVLLAFGIARTMR